MRVELAHSLEQLAARRVRDPLPDEDQRQLLTDACQVRQQPKRTLGIARALDAVLMGVALGELSLGDSEGALVLVDGEEDWGGICR